MPLWAKIDVGLRHHPKLIGRPDADKWLWLCLILHAKEHCPDFIVRDMTPADMRGAFGIKAALAVVTAALAYFLGKGMLVEQPDGGLLIKDMEERQGKYDQQEQRDKWRDIKRKQREKSPLSTVDSGGQIPDVLPLDLEEELEIEKEPEAKDLAQSAEKQPPAPPSPFGNYIRAEWHDIKDPEDFEKRAKKAFPGVDPLSEAQKARGWELSDPRRRKTNHGRFLWGWLGRAQDGASRNGPHEPPPRRPGAANLHVDNEAHQNAVPGRKFI